VRAYSMKIFFYGRKRNENYSLKFVMNNQSKTRNLLLISLSNCLNWADKSTKSGLRNSNHLIQRWIASLICQKLPEKREKLIKKQQQRLGFKTTSLV